MKIDKEIKSRQDLDDVLSAALIELIEKTGFAVLNINIDWYSSHQIEPGAVSYTLRNLQYSIIE